MAFSREQAEEKLNNLAAWQLGEDGGVLSLEKTLSFAEYLQGVVFLQKVAELAEQADHHPDMLLSYASLAISLSTHSAGGLTDLDFDLATKIDMLS